MNHYRILVIISALLLLATGLLLGLFLSPDKPAPAPAVNPPLAADAGDGDAIAGLRLQLQQERQARQALEARVEDLAVRLQQRPAPADSTADNEVPAAAAETAEEKIIDEQVLLAAGISPDQVAEVRRQLEALEMERLYLRDRATREGWAGSARYVEELDRLGSRQEQVRDQLGEDNYGAYLYAIGEPNQVLVQSVIGGSPAQKADLRPGDVLVRYGDQRIYTWSDLRQATSAGKPGEQVRVLIRRDQEMLDTWMERGPMGIRLDVRSEPPQR